MEDKNPQLLEEYAVDKLLVSVYTDRRALGRAAGAAVAAKLRELLAAQDRVAMIFAAAPSQNEFLDALVATPGLDWSRVIAFHMDEYVGLAAEAPQGFGRYLREHLFDLVDPGVVHYLDGNAPSPEREGARYARLLRERPVDLVCLGIGENGHIAFNDPPVADFQDPDLVKVVRLEESCRLQQVHDGCFAALDQVPERALTLTIPTLCAGRHLYCMVPGPTKKAAVERTLTGLIAPDCPATILRRHEAARLFLDPNSAPSAGDCSSRRR